MESSNQILLNDQPYPITHLASLTELLEQLKIDPRFVAVALNDEVISRSLLPQTSVQNGDKVEIIRAVAGG